MGADLSWWVEVLGEDGRFQSVLFDGSFASPSMRALDTQWPSDRNYVEFALLGLRSRRPGVEPIVPSRGVPDDAWPSTKAWIVDHPMVAPSWLTAAELQALDWSMPIRFRTGRHPFEDGLTADAFAGTVDRPIVDVDGVIIRREDSYFMTPDEGADLTDYTSYPVVVDVPLVHVAEAVHAMMESMIALRPDRPDTVRLVYAWDQE